MKNKILFLILVCLLAFSPNLIFAQYDDSVVYLQGQNQNAWITQALIAAQVVDPDISYIEVENQDLMTVVKNILVLAAVGSQETDSLNTLLSTLEANINNGQIGSIDLLNDDFWGLMALSSVGHSSNIETIKSFILSHQNNDGGWSWATTGASDSNDTAAAVMALLDTGLNSSSAEIQSALAYLRSLQNEDGGIGYDAGSQSDGASTAWLISALNKAGEDANTWQKGENNPVIFLESLRQDNGSFLWMSSDEQGSAMVTAYALVALTNSSYPINYIEITEEELPLSGHDIRIEGPSQTICLASNLEAENVLELLEAASSVCNFEYTTENSAYGVYVSSIDGVAAQSMDGWQYFVNDLGGAVAVADYQLTGNERVLWGYGAWPLYASKIEISSNRIELGGQATIEASYYDGQNWQPWSQAPVYIGQDQFQADSAGQLIVTMPIGGVYSIWSDDDIERIRSNKLYLTVGSGISETVDLSVNVQTDGGEDNDNDDTIAFSLDQSNINFGDLYPGQSSETILTLSNTGNVDIYIEASVIGQDIFTDYTSLNHFTWTEYNLNLPVSQNQPVNVGLSVPSSYTASGQKNGQLIFWAVNQ
ncbi:DUF4430 domain-containing protein [Patescibacteria group bacterium]|nr:DUF4430 domain-containing protein [Patescibacteria group bacterium]